MVEVLVAAGALVFVLVGVVSGMILSIRSASFANNQAQATKYTQETIEMLRQFQQMLGWEGFYEEFRRDSVSQAVTYCLPSIITESEATSAINAFRALSPGACTIDSNIPGTIFTREVFVTRGGSVANPIEFEVRVTWAEGEHVQTSTSKVSLYPRNEN